MNKFYISRAGANIGPLTLEELNAKLALGELHSEDMAWMSGMGSDWIPLGSPDFAALGVKTAHPQRPPLRLARKPLGRKPSRSASSASSPLAKGHVLDLTPKIAPIVVASAILIFCFTMPFNGPSRAMIFFPEIMGNLGGQQLFAFLLPLLLGIYSLVFALVGTSPARGIGLMAGVGLYLLLDASLNKFPFQGNGKFFSYLFVHFIGVTFLWAGLRARYYRPQNSNFYILSTIGATLTLLLMILPLQGKGHSIPIMAPFELMDARNGMPPGLVLLMGMSGVIISCIIAIANTPSRSPYDARNKANTAFLIYIWSVVPTIVLLIFLFAIEAPKMQYTFAILFSATKVLGSNFAILAMLPLGLTDILVGKPIKGH